MKQSMISRIPSDSGSPRSRAIRYGASAGMSSSNSSSSSSSSCPGPLCILKAAESPDGMCQDDETKSINYIESGSRLVQKQHKLRLALRYHNPAEQGQKIGAPTSDRGSVDTFDPETITLDQNGTGVFLMKTKQEDPNQPLQVTLNGASAPRDRLHQMLPALFADRFTVTIYYTPLETGFAQDHVTNSHNLVAPNGTTHPYTMSESFYQAVKMEGWGRLKNPVNVGGVRYGYINHEMKLSTKPEDRSGRPLVDKTSCAGPEDLFVIPGSEIIVKLPAPYDERFGAEFKKFTVCDVGQKFVEGKSPHIDIYWKEDNPAGISEKARIIPASFKDVGSPDDKLQVILTKLS